MMILFLLIMLLTNLDRTLILAMISEKALGYFGIATVAAAVVLTIPAAVHSVTLAPVMEKLGRTGNFLTIKNYLSEPMFVMAYILPVFIACIFFAIHLPVRYFLDQYLPSIQVVKILLAGAYFESVAFPVLSVCLALNRQIQLIFMVIPMVGLNFVLNYAVIKAGWGINGVAAATGTTFFITFCVLLFYASVQFGERPGIYLKNLAAILAPFVFSCVLIFCIETFAAFPADSLGFDIVIFMFKI
jgi:O-antigen/teichoic acid export membrane protein